VLSWLCKWQASIKLDGKTKSLGLFETTARGEVGAALAFDAAARAAGEGELPVAGSHRTKQGA
jgi:hypothetical protein